MKPRVNPDRCLGHARCIAFAPEVFDINTDGQSYVIVDKVGSDLEESVRNAYLSCPEEAIELLED